MIVKAPKSTMVIAGEMTEEKAFSIGDDTMIIDFLTDNVYSNPIKVMCQEIMCNAREANMENRRSHVPIRVKMVNGDSIQTSISIADDGKGISPELMNDIFLKYGNSTKRKSNKFVGGFGIGAKSPFAYAKTFTIKTVWKSLEGQTFMSLYTAVKEGAGLVPKLIETGTYPTDAATGTEIIIPIDSKNDAHNVALAVKQCAFFWDVRPNFTWNNEPCEIPSVPKAMYEDGSWKIYYRPNLPMLQEDRVYACVDGILYQIPDKSYYGYAVVHFFRTGDVEIALSREAIRLTEKTIIMLDASENNMKDYMYDKVCSSVAAAPTYLHAIKTSNDSSHMLKAIGIKTSIENIQWNGLPLNIDSYKFKEFVACVKAPNGNSFALQKNYHIIPEPDSFLTFSEGLKHLGRRFKAYSKTHANGARCAVQFVNLDALSADRQERILKRWPKYKEIIEEFKKCSQALDDYEPAPIEKNPSKQNINATLYSGSEIQRCSIEDIEDMDDIHSIVGDEITPVELKAVTKIFKIAVLRVTSKRAQKHEAIASLPRLTDVAHVFDDLNSVVMAYHIYKRFEYSFPYDFRYDSRYHRIDLSECPIPGMTKFLEQFSVSISALEKLSTHSMCYRDMNDLPSKYFPNLSTYYGRINQNDQAFSMIINVLKDIYEEYLKYKNHKSNLYSIETMKAIMETKWNDFCARTMHNLSIETLKMLEIFMTPQLEIES